MFSKTLSHITYTIARKIERNHRFRRTVRELSVLTDRELNDLGINRSDIYRVANESLNRDSAHA